MNLSGRVKFYHFLDILSEVWRLPGQALAGVLKAFYLLFCFAFWMLTLWVLGEKHIGVLKVLILLSSGMVWLVIFFSVFYLLVSDRLGV